MSDTTRMGWHPFLHRCLTPTSRRNNNNHLSTSLRFGYIPPRHPTKSNNRIPRALTPPRYASPSTAHSPTAGRRRPRFAPAWPISFQLFILSTREAVKGYSETESRPDNLDVIGGGREIGLETRDERLPFLAGINFLAVGIDEGIARAGFVGRHGKRRLAVVKQRPAGR